MPQIGWNQVQTWKESSLLKNMSEDAANVYFVHSFYAPISEENKEWVLSTTTYAGTPYISSIAKGNICACQFHPEKSGQLGLSIMEEFIKNKGPGLNKDEQIFAGDLKLAAKDKPTKLVKRVVACLDVRENDQGDLVVTKGDQYDVREEGAEGSEGVDDGFSNTGEVRNLGKPV